MTSTPSAVGSYSDCDSGPDRDGFSSDLGMSSSDAVADHFDRLPDSVLLLVFNWIADVKALGRCCVVSRRFHSLVPQVDNVLVRVDCVISDSADSDHPPSASTSSSSTSDKPLGVLSHLTRLVLGGIVRPLQALGQILDPRKPAAGGGGINDPSSSSSSEVSHHSPTEVLRNFKEIRTLQIELPSGELGVEDGVLLKWKADFGSTLHSCVILGASTVVPPSSLSPMAVSVASNKCSGDVREIDAAEGGQQCGEDNNGSIPESFDTNGSLKLRVVWTISSLIAASARHYLLQPIIADHDTLETLDLTDADGQGVLCMDRSQLEELRVKPVSASGSSQRTLVPALNMRLWCAPHLELPGGLVLKGATLVAIQPSELPRETASMDGGWISNAFDEPYGTAARLLLKRRTYCLEMNSF